MGSLQTPIGMRSSSLLDTSCGYLLRELQMIWDEAGEDKFEREKVLLDIEQECVEAYRRKVDQANVSRSRLHQELAESEAELTHFLLCLGERSVPGRPEKKGGTLREQLDSIAPALREMRLRKDERVKQFRSFKTSFVQLHHLGRALSNLWDLMDASYEDRQKFSHVIDLLSFAPSDVCAPVYNVDRLFFCAKFSQG